MGLIIAVGVLALVVIGLLVAAFQTWNDPRNRLQ